MKKKAYITPKLVIVDVELENELLATSYTPEESSNTGHGLNENEEDQEYEGDW